jgi:transcriptional/translational regulatory protein YebC/TACO1
MAGRSTWANIRHRMGALARQDRPAGSGPAAATKPALARYEGYGPGDCAILVECSTDDRARTRARLKGVFAEHGGYLGAEAAVAYLFNNVGLLTFAPGAPAEPVRRRAWQSGAEDVLVSADGTIEVLTDPEELTVVASRLTRAGFTPVDAVVTQRAACEVELTGGAGRQLLELIEALARLHEVRSVYTNAEVASELLAGV